MAGCWKIGSRRVLIRYRHESNDASSIAIDECDPKWLLNAYRSMLRIRMIEEEIERQYHLDRMKTPIHLVIGQEATAVGACMALRNEDPLYCGHRTHGVYLAKGGDLKAMLSEMHCRTNGCVGSRGGSMHLIDKKVGMTGTSAIVAGSIPIAVGAALANHLRGSGAVTTVFFGEAATEEGVTSESLNFAALKRLPIVFFCENNFYSVQSPLAARQPDRNIRNWAAAHEVHAERVDGTDVAAVNAAMRAAVAKARAGQGSSFIEARTYRYRGHGGAGDDSKTGYRDPAEVTAWQEWDPLERCVPVLERAGLMSAGTLNAMKSDIEREIAAAFDHALASPEPGPEELALHVYSN
jgi:pyruvate dehydrogenase E1 component alpha subunit